ncbi:protein C-ets-2-like [Mizuhopecten yessoensis]|uniref:ETS-related transcription factor Elf-4 n=1 Tax=Mizuhopecten yessoensis TaxID=6573 RepID=A0A210R3Y7_MIZYE|nr:protein C-ets-2-like [Mizuhopecten yessoensis]XP_021363787.1 protein C-ets-2-like [Mizuhopecten yessoensis]XP_021363796.1 protein C-ets-2-like [Mizuhopecten yessoensis]OWF55665.1 ETS-related transcription factor Elf-4 [Mizuhopecten yessoensis]
MDAGTMINYQVCYENQTGHTNCEFLYDVSTDATKYSYGTYDPSADWPNLHDLESYTDSEPAIHDYINLILPNHGENSEFLNMTPQTNFVTGDSESDTDSVMLSLEEYREFTRSSKQEDYPETMSVSSIGSGQFDCYQPPPIPSPVYHAYNNQTLPSFDQLVQSTTKHYTTTTRPCVSDDEGDEESEAIVKKGKRGAKNILLWKFLLDELADVHQKHIRWISCKEGTFRFVDTAEISKMWGAKKRKNDMNFEKLSRGIRHYYKSGFMRREDGTRLVYKFNWKKVPKEYRRRFAL